MIVIIDGKEVEVKNDIKIIVPEEGDEQDLHITLTYEGLIVDQVDRKTGHVSEIYQSLYVDLMYPDPDYSDCN